VPVSTNAAISSPFVHFVGPGGAVVAVLNLADFAAEYNLDRSAVYAVAQGKRRQHKGWSVVGQLCHSRTRYVLHHTDGREAVFDNATEWAEAQGLSPKEVGKVLRGDRLALAGWSRTKGDPMDPKQRTLYHLGGAVETFTDVAAWCAERNLSRVAIYEVLRGVRKSYKGWQTKANAKEHTWRVVDPAGGRHQFQNIRQFALANGLDPSNFRRVLLGYAKSHKGWQLDHQKPPTVAQPAAPPRKRRTRPETQPETIAPQNGSYDPTEAS
jgi:hypothetical protein